MYEESILAEQVVNDNSLEILGVVKKVLKESDILDEEFKDIFLMDAGVIEKLTIEEHTLMVLKQFDKYFAGKVFPDGITDDFFRMLFVLHDVGKPLAIKKGNIKLQHQETVNLIEPILKKLDCSDFEINLSKIIIGSDPIGPYLRFGEIEEAIFKIKKMFKRSGLSSKNFFSVLLIYYMCDASAYTSDVGGLPSLDHLFVFDHENRKLEFSEETQVKMNKLVELIFN